MSPTNRLQVASKSARETRTGTANAYRPTFQNRTFRIGGICRDTELHRRDIALVGV